MVAEFEHAVDRLWDLGRNIVLAWCLRVDSVDILVVPHYYLGDVHKVREDKRSTAQTFFQQLVTGSKRLQPRSFQRAVEMLQMTSARVPLSVEPALNDRRHVECIEAMIQRYGVTYFPDRAVALFDIVGFSKLSAFERLAQLNNLSYSCNAAQSKFNQHSKRFDFASSTTGDGFYIWNRDRGHSTNVDLYNYVHLILADNALARQKSGHRADGAPLLKTAFHIDSYYELFHSDNLHPSSNYIVGDATVVLARMMDKATPGQILIGDFTTDGGSRSSGPRDASRFIEDVQPRASRLRGLKLSAQEIQSIQCYLTGKKQSDNTYSVRRFRITDKHGYRHFVYNAKVNIHRRNSAPIYLGLMDSELSQFEDQPNVAEVPCGDAESATSRVA